MGKKMRQDLEESWAGTFYREIFCRIDETPFAVLYSDQPSRPNATINALVGAEILKAGFGWSDEELWDQLRFNLQARFALGPRQMSSCLSRCGRSTTSGNASVGTCKRAART